MARLRKLIIRNRQTLLVATIGFYMLILVLEGLIVGREVGMIHIQTPYFDLRIRDLDQFGD